MQSQLIKHTGQFLRKWFFLVLLEALASYGIGLIGEKLAHEFLQDAFRTLTQNDQASLPGHSALLPAYFGGLLMFGVFLFLVVASMLVDMKGAILQEVRGDDISDPSFLERTFFPYDPVKELTTQLLAKDLKATVDYFGSITHVPAWRWFGGDNYFTILFRQVQELVDRKAMQSSITGGIVSTESSANLEIFRIVVWPRRWFYKRQSIALLRMLFFLEKEFKIPLRTFLLTHRRFQQLIGKLPDELRAQVKAKNQFWVCRRNYDGHIALRMVWGEKHGLRRQESPHTMEAQEDCDRHKQTLDFLRNAALSLDDVLGRLGIDGMHVDKDVILNLKTKLDENDHKTIPPFP